MKNLHLEFVRLGRERRGLLNRMLLILPEIYESGIWKKYASDIYEYAGRYGGIGRSSVEKRLRLERHLDGKPCLKAAIEKVGVGKVALVASLASSTNEKMFADKALNMSKSALQTLSKELRGSEGINPCKAVAQTITIELDEEMTFQFLKFKKKFKNLNNKEVMKKLLEEADQPAKPAKLIPGDEKSTEKKAKSRYVPTAIKRAAIKNGQCQYPNCNRPSDHIHHPERFAKVRNHKGLVALCKDHHEFMHNGLIENEAQLDWAMNVYKTPNEIDLLYRKCRR